MTFPVQKSFGEFTRERFGPNWVFAHRATDRLRARYDKNNCPVVVITPKQQKHLHADYKREWGAEYDAPAWQALCALRAVTKEASWDRMAPTTQDMICYAIQALTLEKP